MPRAAVRLVTAGVTHATRRRQPDAEASGSPALTLRDEDLELVADALAELLVAALDRERAEVAR